MVERSAVIRALNAVKDPKSGRGLVEAGLVQALVVGEDRTGFMMEVEPADAGVYAAVRAEAEAALKALPGVERAQVVLTADKAPGPGAAPSAGRPRPAHEVTYQHQPAMDDGPVPGGTGPSSMAGWCW